MKIRTKFIGFIACCIGALLQSGQLIQVESSALPGSEIANSLGYQLKTFMEQSPS
jgi:hypothetical protein